MVFNRNINFNLLYIRTKYFVKEMFMLDTIKPSLIHCGTDNNGSLQYDSSEGSKKQKR